MDKQKITAALDALGLALANHDHRWTPEERKLYEEAHKELNSKPK